MPATHTNPETTAERHARQQAQCRRLAELGMRLAELAAQRTEQVLAEQPPATEHPSEPPTPRAPHPASLFAHLSSAVRQAIKLEERIVTGAIRAQADPRRATLRIAIREATQDRSGRRRLREEADELLETELALDPDGTTPLPDLLATICEDLGFELDYEKLASSLAAAAPHPPPETEPAWSQPGWAPHRRPPH